jgi:hypothetical protein
LQDIQAWAALFRSVFASRFDLPRVVAAATEEDEDEE